MTDYLFGAMVQPNTPISISGAIIADNVSVTGSSLPTNGLYLSAANTLSMATASTQRMVVDPNGNVAIGTTPRQNLSVGPYLDVYSGPVNNPTVPSMRASAGNNLVLNAYSSGIVYVNFDSGTGGFRVYNGAGTITQIIDSSGNMGVGASTPAYRLHVATSTTDGAGFFRDLDVTSVGAAAQFVDIGARNGATFTPGARIAGILENPATTGYLTFYTRSSSTLTERMRIDSAGNVSINTTTINTGNKLTVAGTINITDATANRLYMGFGTIPSTGGSGAWIYNSDNSSLVFGTNNTERLRVDTFGNVGLNSTNPVAYDTSGGKVFNIRGTAANSAPATIFMNGDSSLPGAGYTTQEVFRISVTASQEITRLTGTGANGFRMMFRVSLCGHTGAIGNGHIYAMYYWDGGTAAPVQIFRYDSTTNVPSLTFNTTTSNVLIINLSSSGGVNLFQGVMVVEYFVPVDFASSTYTVS